MDYGFKVCCLGCIASIDGYTNIPKYYNNYFALEIAP
jgi:hypothetical protein